MLHPKIILDTKKFGSKNFLLHYAGNIFLPTFRWNLAPFFKHKIPLPYKETVGVGKLSKTVEIKTEEEMLTFLRSEDALFVYSNSKELLAIASLFNVNIKIFTYNRKEG